MSKTKKLLIVISSVIAIFIIAIMVLHSQYTKDVNEWKESKFIPENVYINGLDCSDMKKIKVRDVLKEQVYKHDFVLNMEDGTNLTLPLDGTRFKIYKKIDNWTDTQTFFTYLSYRFGKPFELEITMNVYEFTDEFEYIFDNFIYQKNYGRTETKDAYVDISNTDFKVVKEVYGDTIDEDMLKDDIVKSIKESKYTLDYSDEKYKDVPDVTYDSDAIKERLEYCKTYLTVNISYKFGEKTDTLTPSDLDKLISVKDGKISVDEDAAKEYVASLASKYDTYYSNRTFTATSGRVVTLNYGTYGYIIDQEAEVKQLISDLETGGDILREPVYSTKGNGRDGVDDILDTYVEVDISTQHMYFYKNGKLVVSSACVTGMTKKDEFGEKHNTVPGVFTIAYKEKDATLKGGDESKGTDYESEVKYWMPFFNGIGLHDASWRDEFGGNLYKTDGSHGCVNLPESAAKKLFENIDTGTIVVVFN